jgi:4'-phosphopantetheinyl transferase
MMDVYWLEQTEADLPPENDWLSDSEAVRLDSMRFAKRHADWRLGRWTAKCALAAYLNLPSHPPDLADIEIRSAPSGAPEVFIANQPAGVAISLSHRAGVAACSVTLSGADLGCDLEIIEPRSDAFIADYFATEEQALIERTSAAERSLLLALLWSGKESALKALRTGLRLDTRSVTVSPVAAPLHGDGRAQDPALAAPASYWLTNWRPLQVVYEDGKIFHGWWQNTGDLLRTMVASPRPAAPIFLQATAHSPQCLTTGAPGSRRKLDRNQNSVSSVSEPALSVAEGW